MILQLRFAGWSEHKSHHAQVLSGLILTNVGHVAGVPRHATGI